MSSISPRELVNLYFQYRARSESLGLARLWEMDEWYERARLFNGPKQYFERWFWNTSEPLSPLAAPNFPVYEDFSELNKFPCFYHGCPKQTDPYRSKQSRNNHFDSTHIGVRFFCPKCDEEFRNKGSVRRHQIRFAHWD